MLLSSIISKTVKPLPTAFDFPEENKEIRYITVVDIYVLL